MAMGSAYASGGGLVQKQDSYVPLLKIASDREMENRRMASNAARPPATRSLGGGGGRSSADREAERRRLKLVEQRQEQERQDEWSRKNQYMAAHHGREPTPEELAEMKFEQESGERGLIREEKGRQFDEGLELERSEGALEREARATEKGTGLKDRRAEEIHQRRMSEDDKRIDKEERTQKYLETMGSFERGEYDVVENYFNENRPPGKGELGLMAEDAGEGMVKLKKSGETEPVTVPKKVLGAIMATLSPDYEVDPKETKKTKKTMSRKDAAKIADDYAEGVSKSGEHDYQTAYNEKMAELTEQKEEPPAGGGGGDFRQRAASLVKQIQDTTDQKIIGVRINSKTGEAELTFEGGRKEIVRVD